MYAIYPILVPEVGIFRVGVRGDWASGFWNQIEVYVPMRSGRCLFCLCRVYRPAVLGTFWRRCYPRKSAVGPKDGRADWRAYRRVRGGAKGDDGNHGIAWSAEKVWSEKTRGGQYDKYGSRGTKCILDCVYLIPASRDLPPANTAIPPHPLIRLEDSLPVMASPQPSTPLQSMSLDATN